MLETDRLSNLRARNSIRGKRGARPPPPALAKRSELENMDAMERWPKALVGYDAPGAIWLLRDVEGAHSDGGEEHKSAVKKWGWKEEEEDDDESSGFTLPARFEIFLSHDVSLLLGENFRQISRFFWNKQFGQKENSIRHYYKAVF